MNKLDKLIEQLKIAKEELSKNVNMSYSGSPNEAMKSNGVTHRPESETGSRVGALHSDKKDVGNGRMVAGDSPSPAAVNAELMSNIAAKSENDQSPIRDAAMKKPAYKQMREHSDNIAKEEEAGKEYLDLFKNGQWNIKKASLDPQYAPKDVKVKELQAKIDAKTYKPDSKKIAGAMIKDEDKKAKNETMPMAHPPMGSKDMADPKHEKGMKKDEKSPEAVNAQLQERMMHGLKKK